MERPIFNSRDPAYKVPFGAVSCGRLITFRLCPPAVSYTHLTLPTKLEV